MICIEYHACINGEQQNAVHMVYTSSITYTMHVCMKNDKSQEVKRV